MEQILTTNDKDSISSPLKLDTPVDVSVIIPVYNCERYIEEAIESVRKQEFAPGRYEIIAVNDGSTDRSLAILDRLAMEANDLRIFTIANSGSAAAPRNRGIEEASGRYLFFLDADDKFADGALHRLVQTADDTGSGVILGKMGPFGASRRAGNVPTAAFSQTLFEVDIITAKATSTLGAWKLFRHSIIKENHIRFPLGYAIGEDQPFTMKAYLHSPHVSVLADRVYYWLRGRGDGTNITSTGQTPHKHLSRILTLIDTIIENTNPGDRRDHFLRRPIIGTAGTVSVFGKKLLTAHGRAEREEMLEHYRSKVAPLWNENIRKHAPLASQILVDLAVRNSLDEVEIVSKTLQDRKPLPIEIDRKTSQFVYQPSTGSPVTMLNVKPRVHLERLKIVEDGLEISGEIGIGGLHSSPESAEFVWKNRKSGSEVKHVLDISQTYTRSFGVRALFTATTDVASLSEPSMWDAFVDVSWGAIQHRNRFGKSRAEGVDTRPVLFGDPTFAVATFASDDCLTVDVGPTELYANGADGLWPKVVGHFKIGRTELFQIGGLINRHVRAEVLTVKGDKTEEVQVIKHEDHSGSVIVPRSVTRKGNFSLFLDDANGNRVCVYGQQE